MTGGTRYANRRGDKSNVVSSGAIISPSSRSARSASREKRSRNLYARFTIASVNFRSQSLEPVSNGRKMKERQRGERERQRGEGRERPVEGHAEKLERDLSHRLAVRKRRRDAAENEEERKERGGSERERELEDSWV